MPIMITDAQRRWLFNSLEPQFTVTWEHERRVANTNIYTVLLKPSRRISETFGFENEIPLFISLYPKLQPRSMQAIEQICGEHPLAGRVDTTVAFLYSPDKDIQNWVSRYHSEFPESRIVVPLTEATINASIDDKWKIVNQIKSILFIRDLFHYKLPLRTDRYFYGREDMVAGIVDNVKRAQNSGLFGLRKTGKTSVLYKVQRTLRKSGEAVPILIDCKNRPIRRGSCDDLARRIIDSIDSEFGQKYKKFHSPDIDVFDNLAASIQSLPNKKRLCLIFDEIEYISPLSPTDSQWSKDFIDFWQALWTIQSNCDKVSYIVCGVNPTVCEVDRFPSVAVPERTVQNPMFSIFNTSFLRGLSLESLKNMILFFGSRMGIFFSDEAIEYLYIEYGGHPLLTRLACSFHHEHFLATGIERPVSITKDLLVEASSARDAELSSYCGHVVSEIEELYPREYDLLKLLASGEVADFYSQARRNEDVRHIKDYGLVDVEPGVVPRFKIPVVKRYLEHSENISISLEQANKFPTDEERCVWLVRRSKSIVDDLILLDEELRNTDSETFYEKTSKLRGHRFVDVKIVKNETDAVSFLVHAHKYLVEPADKFLTKGVAGNPKFKKDFPSLYSAFMRLKSYRNKYCHIEINGITERTYERFLQEDFNGADISELEDGWFRLQRRVLDNIHVAVQVEISRL